MASEALILNANLKFPGNTGRSIEPPDRDTKNENAALNISSDDGFGITAGIPGIRKESMTRLYVLAGIPRGDMPPGCPIGSGVITACRVRLNRSMWLGREHDHPVSRELQWDHAVQEW